MLIVFLIFVRRKVLIIRVTEYSKIHKNNVSLGKALLK